MNIKSIMKMIFALFLFTVIFLMGFSASAVKQFASSLSTPLIESETNARNRIMAILPLPENASRLYYAKCGFVDADHYFAFTLTNREECEQYIQK